MCSGACRRPNGVTGSRVNRFDQPRLADCYMGQAGRWVEEGHVRDAGNWPDVGDLSGVAVDLDQGTVIACGVEPATRMVDVQTMRAT